MSYLGDKEAVRETVPATAYDSLWPYYADELRLLDAQLNILHARRKESAPDPQADAFRGMYISEDEFMRLVAGEDEGESESRAAQNWRQETSRLRKLLSARLAASRENRLFLPLPYVSSVFGLSPLEENLIILALAVELERKYERIFGFLQDDLTAKLPTVGLAVQLFARRPSDMAAIRRAMTADSSLYRLMSRNSDESPAALSLLARPLALDPRIVSFLLGSTEPDARLRSYVRLWTPNEEPEPLLFQEELQQRLHSVLSETKQASGSGTGILLWGNPGSGKKLQLRHAACAFGKPLLIADLNILAGPGSADGGTMFGERLDAVLREALLQRAWLALDGAEALFPESEEASERQRERLQLLRSRLAVYSGAVIALAQRRVPLAAAAPERHWHVAELVVPDELQRTELWRRFSTELGYAPDVTDYSSIAGKFRFNPGQIVGALKRAAASVVWNAGEAPAERLAKACYGLVQHRLERRATRIEPRYGWDDIVLPAVQAKLTVGPEGDMFEQEADRVGKAVAEQISGMSGGAQAPVQRMGGSEEEELQLKRAPEGIQRMGGAEEEELQLKRAGEAFDAAPSVEASINQKKGSGSKLDGQIQAKMEAAFGADFSGVNVHHDAETDQLNRSVGALAFTQGNDIFFQQGQYNPGSKEGQELLGHELTHVIQQTGGSKR